MKKQNQDIVRHVELLAPCLALAHAFGRVGCFLGGCCYGQVTDSFWGVVFPEGSPAALHHGYGVKVLPTQLFEATFLLLLTIVLVLLVKKYKISVYLCAYAVFRFLIEFVRGDNRGSLIPGLSPSQLLAFLILAAGIASVFWVKTFATSQYLDAIARMHRIAIPRKIPDNQLSQNA